MKTIKALWKSRVFAVLKDMAESRAAEITPGQVILENPPRPELGDIAIPLFPFAKLFKAAPQKIAEDLAAALQSPTEEEGAKCSAAGPYLNIHLPRRQTTREIFTRLEAQKEAYGHSGLLAGQKIMVEFSSPNTNKPLHLGHLRNDALGESLARILRAAGAEVRSANLINDRGVHICKSMLAYQKTGGGKTPQSEGLKSDHFVGGYYVRYNALAKENPALEEEARAMLRRWEEGDQEVRALWEKMNAWAIEGLKETYRRTGIHFDKFYFESHVYEKGREEILDGLRRGIFYREADGSVWVDLAEIGLDKKALLRGDGTTLYLTQDIGTAIARHGDWPFDRLIYVVASEQNYHFAVLFYVLKLLGYEWADKLYHLSYGMVNLPEGKMKSREGTVVDADDLIKELADMAAGEIRSKEREAEVGDIAGIAEKIALGAIHYYLLQAAPAKDMIFDPGESLSFTGNTGPYLQYMGARISSMLRKAAEKSLCAGAPDPRLLTAEEEWQLVKLVAEFPSVVEQAAGTYTPSYVAAFLYETAKTFSRYYHDYPIIQAEDPALASSRLALTKGVLTVLRAGMDLLNIPFLEVM
jgi:arginyl-tRNA synthetase